MTCKDCLHFKACYKMAAANGAEEFNTLFANKCEDFTDRSEWVHLPCKVGDMVYEICERRNKSKWGRTVVRRVIHGIEIGVNGILSARCGTTITIFLSKLGKTVFLTHEEAEKALKEGKKE